MAANYTKRIDRLLQIYTLIQGEGGWTAEKLADHFDTTPRTIFRDIDVLKNAHIPVHHDPERRCYQIQRDYYMRPLDLTFDESLALVSLGRYINDHEQIPFSRPALKAIAKIRGQLGAPILRELDLVEDHMAVKLAATATQEAFYPMYDRVRKAIATKTCLRCRYESVSRPEDNDKYFLLKPYSLFFNQRAWYVVGYHGLRDEIRTFKLNRFADMQATSQRYEIPKNFTLAKHLGNAWRMIKGEQSYDVELVFDAKFAETISDTSWHPTQEFDNLPGGSLRFTCTVDGLDEIVWWILSMGAHCRVVQPPELVEKVRAEAQNMQSLYAKVAKTEVQPQKPQIAATKH
jgi:predicted DNA-binding transcriptional regulator YafY